MNALPTRIPFERLRDFVAAAFEPQLMTTLDRVAADLGIPKLAE